MKALFRPAMALMNRLKYPHKFALISLLFAFPLALVLYFLVSQINTGIIGKYLSSLGKLDDIVAPKERFEAQL